jgi:hypothetical protein
MLAGSRDLAHAGQLAPLVLASCACISLLAGPGMRPGGYSSRVPRRISRAPGEAVVGSGEARNFDTGRRSERPDRYACVAWPPCCECSRRLVCRFLGCLQRGPIHALRREASEKRQGTKSRLVERRRCSGLYGDLAAAGIVGMVDWTGDGLLAGRPGVAGRAECVRRRCLTLAVSQMRCATRRAGSPPADDRGSGGAALQGAMRAAVMTCRS